MRLIEINEAEAILEPFFDGGTSDHDDFDPRYRVLDEYSVKPLNGAVVKVEQGWAFASIRVDKTVKDCPILRMERSCQVNIHDYDTFIVFGSIPTGMSFDLTARIDGKTVTLGSRIDGVGSSQEYNMPLSGTHLTGLNLTFYADREGIEGELTWFGAAHSGRLARMLAKKNQYSADWPGYFVENPPTEPQPGIGLLFGPEDLPQLREKLSKPPFRDIYAEKKKQAREAMSICPEEYIGRFVPYFDRRWSRSRDQAWAPDRNWNTSYVYSVMENLAFVGLVENDIPMLRMACRHAFSVANCEYWCESPMGVLPGATWHHRSFTENGCCTLISYVLDWCSDLMTPFAKHVLRDALAMKGLPQIESDFRRFEYIRKMNQGIVFSEGRIFAQMALLPRYPRYAEDLERSERDLIEMIGNYVQADGGTPEGPGYWMFTFHECIPAFYALARYHKKPFTHYRNVFGDTGRYELAMLSMEGDFTILHAINDAHPGVRVSCTLASSFYQFTGEPAWKNLYERLMKQGRMDADTFSLISAPLPDGIMLPETDLDRFFPVTGLMGILRQGADLQTLLRLCSGRTCNTHFDEDRGSIVVDAGGYTICPDCGAANYCEAELKHLHDAQAHSLLCPVHANGIRAEQGVSEEGGKILYSRREGTFVEFASDDTAAWSGGVYQKVGRRVTSPIAELAVLEDTFRLGNADYVDFQLNSFGQWRICGNTAATDVGDVTLRVVPLNWSWDEMNVRAMVDGEHRPVWQMCASYKRERAGRLLTALCLERSMTVSVETVPGGWRFKQAGREFLLEEGENRAQWRDSEG
ncbi:MAG: hypothetical protein ACI4PO_09675 [Faecousia sp.]